MAALYNIDAEQGALGLLLNDNAQFDESALKSFHFGYPVHGRIFEAISREIEAGRSATPAFIKQEFEADEELKNTGGGAYIDDLFENAVMLNGIRDYEREIIRHYLRRETMAVVKSIESEIENSPSGEDPAALLSRVEGIVAGFDKAETKAHTLKSSLGRAIEWIERVKSGEQVAYKTGLSNLDYYIGGMKPGSLIVLAGRPGMGKTVAGLNIAEHISQERHGLFFSLEMPTEELSMRMIAGRTGIAVGDQMHRALDDNQLDRIRAAVEKIRQRKLIIDDTAGVDIDYICATARRFNRKYPNGFIVIDHLGLIRGNPRLQKVHQIEEITTRLKSLSKQLGVPVLLLSQLSRAVEMRDDKRPMLSDLRDSGSIEQDADIVMFAYRPEYYLQREEPKHREGDSAEKREAAKLAWQERLEAARGKAYLFVEKNRQGRGGTVKLRFNGERQVFEDV